MRLFQGSDWLNKNNSHSGGNTSGAKDNGMCIVYTVLCICPTLFHVFLNYSCVLSSAPLF